MLKQILEKEIEKAVKKVSAGKVDFAIFRDEKFADYSSNAAMQIGAGVPRENAEKIKATLSASKNFNKYFSKVEIAGPGFLNFWVKEEEFVKNVGSVLKAKNKYGSNKTLAKKKIIVEFTDPNPFKEFHIGHLMSNSIGEFIARAMEFSGAQVKRACYQGDVGTHVAKAVTTLLAWKDKFNTVLKKGNLSEQVSLMSLAYAQGNKQYEESDLGKKMITEVNKKIYTKSKDIADIYKGGREISLKYFEEIYGILGMNPQKGNKPSSAKASAGKHFDFYFFESETGKHGKTIVEKFLKKGVFAKSEGAIVFPEEKSGLHTRVFINSENLPTYEAKELGLAEIKYKKYKYNTSIVVTGNEINEYFKVLLRAMEFVFPKLAKNTKHLSHGMLRLPTGKMSSRTGEVITAVGMLEDIEKIILEKVSGRDLKEKEKLKISKQVALAAVKYSILKQSIGKDIIFDLDKSVSFEGDSGPYIQYTYVRTQSILRNAKESKIKELANFNKIEGVNISHVEKLLQQFPEVVEMAAEKYAPNLVCSYLVELCHAFNAYYAENKIVSNDAIGKYRIALSRAVGQVLKNGLELLGIPAPDKM